MAQQLDKFVLNNGMVVLGEQMEEVGSAAFEITLPCGASTIPKGSGGAAEVISDWVFRGAGSYSSRQLVDALDGLGLQRSSSVGSSLMDLGCAMEAGNLANAIELYSDILQKPRLEEDQFDLSRELTLQELIGLDDDPRQKVMLKLHEAFYPDPLGANSLGTIEELNALTVAGTAEILKNNFRMADSIFAVAGKYDFKAVCEQITSLFDKPSKSIPLNVSAVLPKPTYIHLPHDGAQIHIGLMTPTVTLADENYYNARVAVSILSGGMSSRLFTEVREKRGLCYAVGAQYHNLKSIAGIACYAGSAPDKAQQTLDVIIAEFRRLAEGISIDEIDRAKAGLKSSLIMSSESSSARSDGIANDYFLLGRVRPLDEIKNRINAVTAESALAFLRKNAFEHFTIITIGQKELKVG